MEVAGVPEPRMKELLFETEDARRKTYRSLKIKLEKLSILPIDDDERMKVPLDFSRSASREIGCDKSAETSKIQNPELIQISSFFE